MIIISIIRRGTGRFGRRFLQTRPPLRIDTVLPQIIQPRLSIIPSKQINGPTCLVGNDDAIILATSRPGRLGMDGGELPTPTGKIVGVKVVQPARAASVATKNVQAIVQDDTGRAGTGWRNVRKCG